jgi:SAM-dependent methyltransferase
MAAADMSDTINATQRFARGYSRLAPAYDRALGIPNFIGTRAAFEALVKRYSISFRSAADIGCGTGLFACYLNQCWGVPVFGVDRSPEMLRIAMRNCRASQVAFLRQDIRCLQLPFAVDLITANFDTLNHLLNPHDLVRALRRVAGNLRHGGHFTFDLITPCEPLGGELTQFRELASKGCRVTQRIGWKPRLRMLAINVTLDSPLYSVPIRELHRERAYFPSEVGRWLLDIGFLIRGVHNATTLRSATDCPPRTIIVARKA